MKIQRFENFSEGNAYSQTMKKQMVDWGEFRMYLGKKEQVDALMKDLQGPPVSDLAQWVDLVSDTQIRVVLVKDPEVAHELRELIEDKHRLIQMDYNSNTSVDENLMPGYESEELLAMVKPIMDQVYEATFTEDAKKEGIEDRDEKVMAHILTKVFKWDYESLTKVYAYALEDSNYREEATRAGKEIGLDL